MSDPESSVFDELREQETNDELRESLRRSHQKLERAKASKAEMLEVLYEAARDAANALTIPPVRFAPKPEARTKHDETAIVILTDWQFGKLTPEYSSPVAIRRLHEYADKVVSIIGDVNRHHPVTDARVYLLGDLVEGELIFPGQAHRIDASLYRQVFDGAQLLVEIVRKIATAVPSLKVRGVVGNHGDLGGRSRKEYHPETNADAFLMNTARLLLPDVDFKEPLMEGERAWFEIDEVRGKNWFLAHGNQVKGSSFGVPWYGFKNKALGWHALASSAWDVTGGFQYLATGHWHQLVRQNLNGIEHFGGGSPESANTFAQEWLASGGQQGSQYLVFQNDLGLTSEWPIRLR